MAYQSGSVWDTWICQGKQSTNSINPNHDLEGEGGRKYNLFLKQKFVKEKIIADKSL